MDTIIEILIDISGSMGSMKDQPNEDNKDYLLPDGSTRITLAKKILLEEILPTINYAQKIIVRTFFADHSNNSITVIRTIYDGPFIDNEIRKTFFELPDDTPKGGTPLTASILKTIENLKQYDKDAFDRIVILVTDGEGNGIEDKQLCYTDAIEKARKNEGLEFKVYIIGISLCEEAEKKATEITNLTQGAYLSLKATNYNAFEIKQKLAPLQTAILQGSIDSLAKKNEVKGLQISERFQELEKKLESSKNSSQYSTILEQIEFVKKQLNETQKEIQKMFAELINLIKSNHVVPVINQIEERVAAKAGEISSEISQRHNALESNFSNWQTSANTRFQSLEQTLSTLFQQYESVVNKANDQNSFLDDLKNQLADLNDQNKLMQKKSRTNHFITWGLVIIGIVTILALRFFKV